MTAKSASQLLRVSLIKRLTVELDMDTLEIMKTCFKKDSVKTLLASFIRTNSIVQPLGGNSRIRAQDYGDWA